MHSSNIPLQGNKERFFVLYFNKCPIYQRRTFMTFYTFREGLKSVQRKKILSHLISYNTFSLINGLKLSIVTVNFTSAMKGLLSWKRICYSTHMMDCLALYIGLESVGQIDRWKHFIPCVRFWQFRNGFKIHHFGTIWYKWSGGEEQWRVLHFACQVFLDMIDSICVDATRSYVTRKNTFLTPVIKYFPIFFCHQISD